MSRDGILVFGLRLTAAAISALLGLALLHLLTVAHVTGGISTLLTGPVLLGLWALASVGMLLCFSRPAPRYLVFFVVPLSLSAMLSLRYGRSGEEFVWLALATFVFFWWHLVSVALLVGDREALRTTKRFLLVLTGLFLLSCLSAIWAIAMKFREAVDFFTEWIFLGVPLFGFAYLPLALMQLSFCVAARRDDPLSINKVRH